MVHGFGHDLPCESRALHRGVSDSACLQGGLALEDKYGGGLALQEHFVTLEKMPGSHWWVTKLAEIYCNPAWPRIHSL